MSARAWTWAGALLALTLPLGADDWRDQRPGGRGADARAQRDPLCRSSLIGHVERTVRNHGDDREEGVPHIPVRLLGADGRVAFEARTDRNGRYEFRGACAGHYTVCPGVPCPTGGRATSRYRPESREIDVPPATVGGLDFLFLDPPERVIDQPYPAR